MKQRTYLCIDLKSFYASVECVARGMNPMTENLVVADPERTEKTICLAITPAMKALGIRNRCRIFEIPKHVRYTVAPPRMQKYIDTAADIYSIYLQYIAREDIHVYSIDEAFMDVTDYLTLYHLSARELGQQIMTEIFRSTGIRATCGVGSNLYLAKIALDITAKHAEDFIGELNEDSYRTQLWDHRPLTDFWRVGRGYAKKLAEHGIFTMGDIARCSVGKNGDYYNEELLYRLFGINAELLIDHAWGYESCTLADVKAYKPQASSSGAGQVLQYPYTFEKAKLVLREMAERLALDLLSQQLMTDQIVLIVSYDRTSNTAGYRGELTEDYYGRRVPKHAHGSINLSRLTSSGKLIVNAAVELYDRIVDPKLLVRRLNIVANNTTDEKDAPQDFDQLDLFTDLESKRREKEALARERSLQKAMLEIQHKYGKNAILKANSLQDGATARDRNRQIGGHRA